VVARPSLGTINHTVLTCFSARHLDLTVAGVIINNYPEQPGPAEQGAPHQIGALCGAPVLGLWPHSDAMDTPGTVEYLAEWLDHQPETDIVLRQMGI
jgi:dethiobiotin synthetase